MKSRQLDTEYRATAADWIARIADGELSSADKAALADWLRDSPRSVREFIELTLLNEDVRALRLAPEQIDAWVREAQQAATALPASLRLCQSPQDASAARTTSSRRRPWLWTIAASIIAAVLLAGAYQRWQDGRYVTGFGEQRALTLADGSIVTVNVSSALRVDFSGRTRAIRLLKGEAFFRVAHDTARPFEVTAGDTTVKAVGTQFNVRIAPLATVVSVLDGAVEVRDRATRQGPADQAVLGPAVRLGGGEEARIDRTGALATSRPSSIVKAKRATKVGAAAWTQGRVEFEATALVDVFSEFQRYSTFSVTIAEPLRQLKLTGSFNAQDPEAALAYVATLPGVVVEKPAPRTFLVRQRE